MPTFSSEFFPPPAISGLTLDADLGRSRVYLSWDHTAIAEPDFDGYRIYRSRDSGATYKLIRTLNNGDSTDWSDYGVPLNVDVIYRVTQSTQTAESEPVEAAASLTSPQWWVVTPGDEDQTFAIPRVRAASMTSPKVQEIFSPMGRSSRVVVGDVVQEEEGEISFLVTPTVEDPRAAGAMVALLRRLQRQMEGSVILKAPDGLTHYVQYGDMKRSFTEVPGMQEITIPFYGTDETDE